jgi:CRP-like cAMP-binding protein
VFRINQKGEELTISVLKPDDFFPFTFGMNNTTANSYFLEAITTLEIWSVPQEQFLAYVKSNPDLLYALTNRLLTLFDGMLVRMEYLVFSSAYIKIAATLFTCAMRFGRSYNNGIIIPVPFTHRDIATMVGHNPGNYIS